ncbi:MAG: glycosyltransferase family 39 protein [Actinomycetota bacterium]|nr:glycosyltransferase family 39 protein [Actinomycetota bacterium]
MRKLSPRRWHSIALASIAAGALIRFVYVLAVHPPLEYVYSDMEGYVMRATKLASGAPLDRYDAFYPPGTHIVLAVPLELLGTGRPGLWGAAVLWAGLSSLTPFFAWRFARLLLTPAAAALTAALTAIWPLHITYAGYFTSETPLLAFLTGALWLGYRARESRPRTALALGLAAGLLGGAAIANRPQFALNLVVLGLPLLLAWRRHWPALAGVTAGASLVVAGVIAHNSGAAGKLTSISENSGVTFFIGQCDVLEVRAISESGFSASFSPPPAYQRGAGRTFTFKNRAIWDQGFFYSEGWKCIRRNGIAHSTMVARSLAEMTATTVPWPQVNERGVRDAAIVANFVYSAALPVIVFAAVALIQRRRARGQRAGELTMVLHLACVVVVALVIFGDPRFRTPYDVFGLALLGAVLADRWLDRSGDEGEATVAADDAAIFETTKEEDT